ncbi:MAG: hypothetical protein Q9209_006971, partial [Squamulea sp. 1 TL-2023]
RLSNEDLAHLLNFQPKDLRKLCGRLREDRLLAVHSRQEIREGLQRPINRDYYYVDYHATVDAVKYRVLLLTAKVKLMFKPSEEKKDFYCPHCTAQWTQMEILDSFGPTGFLCHRCGDNLEREERPAGDASGSEKQVKLAAQLERVLKLLQEIDNATIPKNDFETALSLQVPVQRNKDVNPVRSTVPTEVHHGTQMAVKGINQPVLQDLAVDLTEKGVGEELAEAQRTAALAAQNMLPIWHTQSTVSGSSPVVVQSRTGTNSDPTRADSIASAIPKFEGVEEEKNNGKASVTDENEELAAYYTRMAQEKEKEEREDREDEASSTGDYEHDEDEEEFEDIGVNLTATGPQPNLQVAETGNLKPRAGDTKGSASESGSSAPASVISTPAAALDDRSPAGKRVKLEVTNGHQGVPGTQAVSDEDEEAEFEDAL